MYEHMCTGHPASLYTQWSSCVVQHLQLNLLNLTYIFLNVISEGPPVDKHALTSSTAGEKGVG